MTLRWAARALSDANQRFRKLCGDRGMKTPLAALAAMPPTRNAANKRSAEHLE